MVGFVGTPDTTMVGMTDTSSRVGPLLLGIVPSVVVAVSAVDHTGPCLSLRWSGSSSSWTTVTDVAVRCDILEHEVAPVTLRYRRCSCSNRNGCWDRLPTGHRLLLSFRFRVVVAGVVPGRHVSCRS